MGRYFVKRVLGTIPLLLVISFLIFMFIHLIPGDPVRNMAGREATTEELENLRESMGFNKPLYQQYFSYLNDLFHGDLGISYKTKLPVSEMMIGRLKPTLKLTFFAMLWSTIVGIAIGVLSAINRGKLIDYLGMLIAISGISIPGFWLGLVMIQIFSVKLGWVPTGGLDTWKSYFLPSITLGCGIMAILARFSRSSMLDSLGEDYVRTARAKGQRERLVILRHAFRNSLVQVVTVIGLQIGGLLAGSVLIETVFTIPGLGRLLVDSLAFRDYKVVQALLLFFSFEYILINLIVDLLYGVLNPRIRLK
ncbi:MAG TPA: ABC transporter permease subunit [Flexilinea sp.]|nr:ABC transporter permease subunit [Flexilinea sp.]OQA24202.1 MAG: Glutathione transport system permease protein GsiC [Chloroflexi bacterium ADurb.Bin344]HNY93137.1 ABC transporter permease subunit [Flexilinea sp.]HOG21494.1 ABC transporter permease subunit [Flexilinea sp.]HOG60152.1 ABC transporter permease subunit [Flexilinea sp.]